MYGEKIEGFEKFSTLIDVENSLPLSFLDMWALSEITAELPIAYYAGIFMLQATGLGGWMFNGMDPFSVLRASGKTDVHVLDFRYDIGERWVLPNPTGLQGMFEVYTLLPYTICARPYMPLQRGNSGKVALSIPIHPGTTRIQGKSGAGSGVTIKSSKPALLCRPSMYDRFGKFPGTVLSIFVMPYLQAQHLDLEFYDHLY